MTCANIFSASLSDAPTLNLSADAHGIPPDNASVNLAHSTRQSLGYLAFAGAARAVGIKLQGLARLSGRRHQPHDSHRPRLRPPRRNGYLAPGRQARVQGVLLQLETDHLLVQLEVWARRGRRISWSRQRWQLKLQGAFH